jgi:hypothetical protein
MGVRRRHRRRRHAAWNPEVIRFCGNGKRSQRELALRLWDPGSLLMPSMHLLRGAFSGVYSPACQIIISRLSRVNFLGWICYSKSLQRISIHVCKFEWQALSGGPSDTPAPK